MPVCGLGLERGEQGYWLGAYFFNLMAMETLFSIWVVGLLGVDLARRRGRSSRSLRSLMAIVPFAFFPFEPLFLAFDLWVARRRRRISPSHEAARRHRPA